jgi:serine/threonine-protein kinase
MTMGAAGELAVGDEFERYRIEAVLGQGGMGQVYRAYDSRLRRRVALKVLRKDLDGAPADKAPGARLLREARAAAALSHPNIVSIFDVGQHGDVPYLAMELVSGRNLRAYVGDASIPLRTKLRWLVDVARALAAAHARGLVHRDVKPENVVVCEDGMVKVLDFGIASLAVADAAPDGAAVTVQPVAAEEPPISATSSTVSRVVGTPRFMSPEQLCGEPLDPRSDQFS